jgi:hypothetical protein
LRLVVGVKGVRRGAKRAERCGLRCPISYRIENIAD